ncbi:beta-hydroxylase [Sphingomonas sp. BE123]|uniref:aspartyl/asparaginyl beta-hydroxylase domain-containing protein n=1 Tax=Sphingomonas sp. BE123 TaxID=2817842 RepID=UPI00285C7CDF|nr:aspartyl/asparaginyl beta-hydroxylase domain-containing protein [Sphingomonas sp. BE123]MDR6851977.1 beta-hydroxylase [Sphingomonas sp. BE123]
MRVEAMMGRQGSQRQQDGGRDAARPAPALALIPGAAESEAPPRRGLAGFAMGQVRAVTDRVIARFSLVPTHPILDVRGFCWTAPLRAEWEAIRREALALALPDAVPAAVLPGARGAVAPLRPWQAWFLWGYGYRVEEALARCPVTAALVGRIPGLVSAHVAVLSPGAHVPASRGATKGLLTCHLGLHVPRDGDARIRVGDRILRWAEGETLLFDDTVDHELWNDAAGVSVLLVVQVRRPLRQPGRWLADAVITRIRQSAIVQRARRNLTLWQDVMRALRR